LVSIEKQNVSHRFAAQFEKLLFKNGYEETDFSITENVDQYALHRALMADDARAIIWVSHGANPRLSHKMKRQMKHSGGMSGKPELIDYRGDNVAPIFKNHQANLKFVSVIGCNSQQVLSYVGSDLATDDSIVKLIPHRRVIAQIAIRKSIRALNTIDLESTTDQHTSPISTPLLTITRSIPADSTASNIRPLRIVAGNTLLGVIPEVAPGETGIFTLPIPESGIKSIQLETGQPIMTNPASIEFGSIKIELPTHQTMRLFAKSDGTPFGLNTRLFLLP
jgi:hypothetical protein